MWRANFKMKDIIERLAEEGVKVSRTAVHNLLTKFKKTESVGDMKRRARSRQLSAEHYRHIDELMAENTNLTSRQLAIFCFKRGLPNRRNICLYPQ
jgi:hypothetical protein